ncbi:MAG TPA: erythromycin esterase family protein [Cytophagaceae bacterium]
MNFTKPKGRSFFLLLMIMGICNNFSCKEAKSKNMEEMVKVEIPAHPLRNAQDLDVLMESIGDARVVLLGESSHGTSEYYTWRAAISKRLIEEKGFDFIAVEGEWADSYRINNLIKGEKKDNSQVVEQLRSYDRWPTWMWGNYEVASLVTWLNTYNQSKGAADKVGFFGLDVYCLWESLTELNPYLQDKDPQLQKAAERSYNCFKPYSANPEEYASAVARASADCHKETEQLWNAINKMNEGKTAKTEADFVMEQNALVALNGEKYYTASTEGGPASWNIRDQHMMQTLKRLLDFHGPTAKAIVWEHNTHVGDARYTDMAGEGMVNVGQLVRQEYGNNNVFIVGLGSYEGSVIAASSWGGAITNMNVPPAQEGSWESMLHKIDGADKIVISSEIKGKELQNKRIGHRAIGVVYNPAYEQYGNYVPTVIPKRYDAFLFIDRTKALTPLNTPVRTNEPPDLFPSGL